MPRDGEESNGTFWRGGHVVARFLPMIVLGLILVIYGLSPIAPHVRGLNFGLLFIWVGGVLLVGAVLGMLFTKCPVCYRTNWVVCVQEPDVVRRRDSEGADYYSRELATVEEDV